MSVTKTGLLWLTWTISGAFKFSLQIQLSLKVRYVLEFVLWTSCYVSFKDMVRSSSKGQFSLYDMNWFCFVFFLISAQ